MKNFSWQTKTLTAEQLQAIDEWRYAADPAQRLFTDYYTWLRWGLLEDYAVAMGEAKGIEDKDFARKVLDETLQKLREDYEKDIDLFFEIKFAMHSAFSPVKLKLQWQTNVKTNTAT